MILTRIYTSFGKNHGKLQTVRSISATGNRTQDVPSTSFEHRIVPPLVGPFQFGFIFSSISENIFEKDKFFFIINFDIVTELEVLD